MMNPDLTLAHKIVHFITFPVYFFTEPMEALSALWQAFKFRGKIADLYISPSFLSQQNDTPFGPC